MVATPGRSPERGRDRRWPSPPRRRGTARAARGRWPRRGQVVAEPELHHGAGVQAARAGGDVVLLLVAAAGDVVLEQPPLATALVVAGEDRHDAEPCMAAGRLLRTIWPSWLALPSRLSGVALDLLVVLELQLEELDHLDGRTGRAGDGDTAVAVGREHLLHRPVRDQVARGGPPVAGHHDAVGSGRRRTVVPWGRRDRLRSERPGSGRGTASSRCDGGAQESSSPDRHRACERHGRRWPRTYRSTGGDLLAALLT